MYSKEEILLQTDQLAEKIKNLETIKEYRIIEKQIHENQTIQQKMNLLKKQQKQAVNFQNYGKLHAFEQSEGQIHDIEEQINRLPIVEQFQSSQYEANELLQMFISTMETRLNEYNKAIQNNQ